MAPVSQPEDVSNVLTKFSLKVACVAVNMSGNLVAAGSECVAGLKCMHGCMFTNIAGCRNMEIKVVSTLDKSAFKLAGHQGAIRALDFDPHGEFLVRAVLTFECLPL
jgi:hypothetical protein